MDCRRTPEYIYSFIVLKRVSGKVDWKADLINTALTKITSGSRVPGSASNSALNNITQRATIVYPASLNIKVL